MADSFSELLSRGLDGSPKGSFGSRNLLSTVSLNDGVSKNIVWKQDMVAWIFAWQNIGQLGSLERV